MQPNPGGVIPGTLAKEFFEKSRLPISELRVIWQLSDVSKDGCLSLDEFLTAMHLVVLRRNDIALPDALPNCLRPDFLRRKLEPRMRNLLLRGNSDKTSAAHDAVDASGTTAENRRNAEPHSGAAGGDVTTIGDNHRNAIGPHLAEESLTERPIHDDLTTPRRRRSSEAVATTDDINSLASVVSTPSTSAGDRPKPVNFDFTRPDIRLDPHIVQPMPLRISSPPDSPSLGTGSFVAMDLLYPSCALLIRYHLFILSCRSCTVIRSRCKRR